MMPDSPIDPRLEQLYRERQILREQLRITLPTTQPYYHIIEVAVIGTNLRIKNLRDELGIVPEKGKGVRP